MSTPQTLVSSLITLAKSTGGELAWFAGQMAAVPNETAGMAPNLLPVCALLRGSLELTSALTRPTVRCLVNAAPLLHWQQSYTEADGFDRAYLDTYGWFNLVSPEGLFHHDSIRVSIGYWGSGLKYPEHWHKPEEFYLVLAGGAKFISKGRAPCHCGPGDVVHHKPGQPHAIDMTPGPLLVAGFWRGEQLLTKSTLKAEQ